ncbi:MAG: HIT domain-containing protein [Phycisphaerae bacterium]|nr:HIT domain-containing protein [Phycisphaerae bacterium]
MNHQSLWAPWRMAYLRGLDDRAGAERLSGEESPRNFLLDYWQHAARDREHHVIHRNAHGIILLNRYPYSNGHLLVALGEPRPTLLDYAPEQRAELWKLVDLAALLATRTLNPQGLNIGVNEGRAAGAGVPEHLHVHVVPRWSGDVNFMAAIGGLRMIPDSLDAVHEAYARTLSSLA